jgi:hypothetical protein
MNKKNFKPFFEFINGLNAFIYSHYKEKQLRIIYSDDLTTIEYNNQLSLEINIYKYINPKEKKRSFF